MGTLCNDFPLPRKDTGHDNMAVFAVCDIIKTSEIAYNVQHPVSATE